ncbi:hypothetical protein HDG35_004309 [Paraburkholderia sp. JPY681]|uniref:Uncharacterized protein n=1 Tax=Paraburkholderia atlantica TaxID=2654982 RepID=D5WFZ3_PARAM|nr:hypothetical protein BC1002_5441 [Paraburkholderia atlantica]MBB5508031.1 hypothetical protein [Paraburkholderia atlantica]
MLTTLCTRVLTFAAVGLLLQVQTHSPGTGKTSLTRQASLIVAMRQTICG